MRIGVISDTHGLLRPQALAALAGSELILHAGDIGTPEVLSALEAVAPVLAVRGNNDTAPWAQALSETRVVEVGGKRFYLLHDLKALDIDPLAAGIDVVVAGHSHRSLAELREGVLYLNPGSAGPQRFSLPVSVARLTLHADRVQPELLMLE